VCCQGGGGRLLIEFHESLKELSVTNIACGSGRKDTPEMSMADVQVVNST